MKGQKPRQASIPQLISELVNQTYSYVWERYRDREYIYLDRTRVILFKMAIEQNQEKSVRLVKDFWSRPGAQRSQDGEKDEAGNREKRLFKHLETNLLEILQEEERQGEQSLSKFLAVSSMSRSKLTSV